MFFTINGRFINTAFHNIDFDTVAYHAAVSFGNTQCSITANFGSKGYKFGIEDMLSNTYKEMYEEISQETIDSKDIFDLVHDYLLYSGFVGTLHAFEDESSFDLLKKEKDELEQSGLEYHPILHKSTSFIGRKNTLNDEAEPFSLRTSKIKETAKEESEDKTKNSKDQVKEENKDNLN